MFLPDDCVRVAALAVHLMTNGAARDSDTIDIAGLPVGQHKLLIELVNANHQIVPGQTKTVTFTLPVALRHEQ